MRLKEFAHDGITVKYARLGSKQGSRKALVVVLANPFERDGTVEFLHSLIPFDVPRLFIAAAKEYQYGLHLVKDGTTAPRDAILALIEKTRIECQVERKDTYLVGFCMASHASMVMAVEHGYNAIITELILGGTLFELWDDRDPKKKIFRDHQDATRGPHMDISYDVFYDRMREFTGRDGFTRYPGEYLDLLHRTEPDKFKVPVISFLAGKEEESWVLFGNRTVETLRGYGLRVDVTVSPESYGHMEAIPHFIAFFSDQLRNIGA